MHDASAMLDTLRANVLSIIDAPLPALYVDARSAIAKCAAIDQCKDWADKAEALAKRRR